MLVRLDMPFQSPVPSLPVIPLDNSYSILGVPAQKTLPARLGGPSLMLVLPYYNSYGPQDHLNFVPKCLWASCLPAKNLRFLRARIKSISYYHGRVGWDEGLLVQPSHDQRASKDIILN